MKLNCCVKMFIPHEFPCGMIHAKSLRLTSAKPELFRFGRYRSGTVNSKSFIGKVLLRIKWKFELTVYFKHGILGKL